MQEIIQAVTQKFGISESSSKSAIGGLLQMIEGQVDQGDFRDLVAKVPGASEFMSAAPAASGGEGGAKGMLGGVLGAASSALGGKTGTALGLGALLENTGIGLDDAGGFVSMVVDFFREKAGDDLVGRILGKVPEIGKLLG